MRSPIRRSYLLVAIMLCAAALPAQQTLRLDPAATTIVASGSSTFAKWEMPLQDGRCSGSATFVFGNGELTKLTGLEVQVEAEGLQSNKKGMNKDAYAALKTNAHPNLTFVMTAVRQMEKQAAGYLVVLTGDLNIAGMSRSVEVEASCTLDGNRNITCAGTHTLNMTDFGVEPPKTMLGMVKAGEEVTVDYRAVFKP